MNVQLKRGLQFANSLSNSMAAVRRERIDGIRLADWFLQSHRRSDDEVRYFMSYVASKSYLPKWAKTPGQVKAAARSIEWMPSFTRDAEGKWARC